MGEIRREKGREREEREIEGGNEVKRGMGRKREEGP